MDSDKISLESLIQQIKSFLKICMLSSPVYGNLKRQLAECLIGTGKSLEGVVHLIESLGGKHKFDHLMLEEEYELKGGANNKENIQNVDIVKMFNSIPLEYPSPSEFLVDLNSLPVEWTLVQITRQPQTVNILQDVKEHGENMFPFSLGEARLVVLRSGESPLQVLVDKPLGSDDQYMKSYFDLLSDALKIDLSSRLRTNRDESSRLIKDVSKSLGECWLREYQCLLPGQLKSSRLQSALHATLNAIRSSLVAMTTEAASFLRHVLSGVHVLSEGHVYDVLRRHVTRGDELLTRHVLQQVVAFKQRYGAELATAARYPVLLLLEEELDKLPWETAACLRGSPVSRVHCFQFLVALARLHGSDTDMKGHKPRLRRGYLHLPRIHHEKETFVILNPGADIPSLETHFKTFLNKKLGKWKGISGRVPSPAEFGAGLSSHSLFVYCGHGDGTIYFPSDKLGRSRVRSVTMLFGCRSVERSYQGGRVPFSSIVQKYFVAGCPCIIGNLWSVTSTDCDRIASNLINLSFPSSVDLSSITPLWWNVPPPPHTRTDSHASASGNETPEKALGHDSGKLCKAENGANRKASGKEVKEVQTSKKGKKLEEECPASQNGPNVTIPKARPENGSKNSSEDQVVRLENGRVKASSADMSGFDAPIVGPKNTTARKGTRSNADSMSTNESKVTVLTVESLIIPTNGSSSTIPNNGSSSTIPTNGSSSVPVFHSPDLCANVQWSRQATNYFLNGAALVMWGLPVWFGDEEEDC